MCKAASDSYPNLKFQAPSASSQVSRANGTTLTHQSGLPIECISQRACCWADCWLLMADGWWLMVSSNLQKCVHGHGSWRSLSTYSLVHVSSLGSFTQLPQVSSTIRATLTHWSGLPLDSDASSTEAEGALMHYLLRLSCVGIRRLRKLTQECLHGQVVSQHSTESLRDWF